MYRENVTWAQAQEREMRLFAADENEKQKRCKPMPAHQRAFLHSMAEDFGFDSESMDPEPHRHVLLFKTPRFVSAPVKTVGMCVRIRSVQAATEMQSIKAAGQKVVQPWNAFLLLSPRFGLTEMEVRSALSAASETTPGLGFVIHFLPSNGGDIVIQALPASASTSISAASIEATLKALKIKIAGIVAEGYPERNIAREVKLCVWGEEEGEVGGRVVRREDDNISGKGGKGDGTAEVDGWSQVAAKGAGRGVVSQPVVLGGKGKWAVLGVKRGVKKKEDEGLEVEG